MSKMSGAKKQKIVDLSESRFKERVICYVTDYVKKPEDVVVSIRCIIFNGIIFFNVPIIKLCHV